MPTTKNINGASLSNILAALLPADQAAELDRVIAREISKRMLCAERTETPLVRLMLDFVGDSPIDLEPTAKAWAAGDVVTLPAVSS